MALARLTRAVLLVALQAWSAGEARRPDLLWRDDEVALLANGGDFANESQRTEAPTEVRLMTQRRQPQGEEDAEPTRSRRFVGPVVYEALVQVVQGAFPGSAWEFEKDAAGNWHVRLPGGGPRGGPRDETPGGVTARNVSGDVALNALEEVTLAIGQMLVGFVDLFMDDTFWTGAGPIHLFIGVFAILYLGVAIVPLCVLIGYKRNVSSRRPNFPDPVPEELSMESGEDFHHSIFSCIFSTSSSLCFFAAFCPCLRHADTLSAAGLWGFWTTVIVWLILDSIASVIAQQLLPVTGGLGGVRIIQGILLALVFAPSRRKLRKKFNSTSEETKLMDYVYWCLLPECSLAQEGLQVDSAQGVEVRCCCSLYDEVTGQLVGEAVKADD